MWNGDSVSFSNSQQRVSPVLELNAGALRTGDSAYLTAAGIAIPAVLDAAREDPRPRPRSVACCSHGAVGFDRYRQTRRQGTPVAGVSKRSVGLLGSMVQFDVPNPHLDRPDAQAHQAAAERM